MWIYFTDADEREFLRGAVAYAVQALKSVETPIVREFDGVTILDMRESMALLLGVVCRLEGLVVEGIPR